MKFLKEYVIDTTSGLVESSPLFAFYEVSIGMSNEVSQNSRLQIIAASYSGLGWVFAKGRDIVRKKLNIDDKTPEKIQRKVDAIYNAFAALVIAAPVYGYNEPDPKKAVLGVICAMAIGYFNGAPIGFTIDVFRDLTSLKPCERTSYPRFIKKQSPLVKKVIAAGLVAGAIGAMSGIYSLNTTIRDYFNRPAISSTVTHSYSSTLSLERVVEEK